MQHGWNVTGVIVIITPSHPVLHLSIQKSQQLMNMSKLMFYNLVCFFGWIRWNFNLDFEFGYVLHVQNLCEWRERQIPLFDLVSLAFLLYILFWVGRDIKFEQKYLFTPDFNRGGLRKTNRTYHRWVKWYFSNHGQAKWFLPKPQGV